MNSDLKSRITDGAEVICICEGSSEKALIEHLLDRDLLIFNERSLVGDRIWHGPKYRAGKNFESIYGKFLTMSNIGPVVILLIQDNYDKYKLSKKHLDKVDCVEYIVTKPELEMIYIHQLDIYNDWQTYERKNKGLSKKIKASEFLAQHLKRKVSEIKNHKLIKTFCNSLDITKGIMEYKSKHKLDKSKFYLADLLK